MLYKIKHSLILFNLALLSFAAFAQASAPQATAPSAPLASTTAATPLGSSPASSPSLTPASATAESQATNVVTENSDLSKYGSLAISVFALLVSGSVAIYTYKKDSRARRHSIEDDYWLRKVIGPVVIEPLLSDVLEMIGATPKDCASKGFSVTEIQAFHDSYLKKLSELAQKVSALGLVSDALAQSTASIIDNLQELLIAYCYDNQVSALKAEGIAVSERKNFQAQARTFLIDMLKEIKSYQMRLK